MVDKVKPLKFETSVDGTQTDIYPTEADPTEDYLTGKGFSYENSDDHRSEKIGDLIAHIVPNFSLKPTFLANKEIEKIEYYNGATQTEINRRAIVEMTYDGNLDPTVEVWKIFDTADGTTVLKTFTITHTWVSNELTKSVEVTT